MPQVVPTVAGQAWITQHCTVVVDPTDPFPNGYTVGDIWLE
jgi:proline racemase